MVEDKLCSNMAEDLRKQAEERTNKTQTRETLSPEETSYLLHELQVHQIELEMQNDELRRVQVKLEASRARYFELYDLAPVGYFTISEQGIILEVNLTAATLFGVTRGDLIKRPLSSVILPDDQDIYYQYRKQLFATGAPQVCELRMRRANATPFWARLDAIIAEDTDDGMPVFHGVVSDITEHKQNELALRKLNETLENQVVKRTSAIQMLHDISSTANLTIDVQEILEYCLRRVAQQDDWDFAYAFFPDDHDPDLLIPVYVWHATSTRPFLAFLDLTFEISLQRGQGIVGSVYDTGEPKWSTEVLSDLDPRQVDLAKKLGIITIAAFPVIVEQRTVGVLEFFSEKVIVADKRMYSSMINIGTQIGRVIERKAFQDRLFSLAEEEHRRIGQELHDDVGQELTGLALKIETLVEMLDRSGDPSYQLAREVAVSLERTRRKSRALSRGLVPAEIDPSELNSALEELASRTRDGYNVACQFHYTGHGPVPNHEIATQLYRITQEAVANSLSHAQAKNITITLAVEPGEAVLMIQDDGVGLPPKSQRGPGMGLQIMRYRAGLIRGQFEIESPAAGGTWVVCRLPIKTA